MILYFEKVKKSPKKEFDITIKNRNKKNIKLQTKGGLFPFPGVRLRLGVFVGRRWERGGRVVEP